MDYGTARALCDGTMLNVGVFDPADVRAGKLLQHEHDMFPKLLKALGEQSCWPTCTCDRCSKISVLIKEASDVEGM